MNEKERTRTSKFLSLVLRHEPEKVGLQLDPNGWVEVEALVAALRSHGRTVDRDELDEIVAACPKQRFAFSADRLRIRANQGHSVEIELGYVPQTPPDYLFHGTATRFLDSILSTGLNKAERHHVHLSAERDTAEKVGPRHGKPVILTIRAGAMHAAGHAFFLSENGVWLTDRVPVEFIQVPRDRQHQQAQQ